MIKDLTTEQKNILFKEETEAPGSSSLNYEKREGNYFCAGCGTKLFESSKKYESGSGWPSFFEALPNVFETKIDTLVGLPEQSIIVKNVVDTMDIFLMMVQNLLEKGIVIMVYV